MTRILYCFFTLLIIGFIPKSTLSKIASSHPIAIEKLIQSELKFKKNKEKTRRFTQWKKLIKNNKLLSDQKKVKMVNDFFNNQKTVNYAEDIYIWGQNDYWATPIEFMLKTYGDCEDYAIAKYFTLISMKVNDEDLRITYVRLKQHQYGGNKDLAHMVLTYYPEGKEIPLVLDNVNRNLISADKRKDLQFIYSFNGKKLWVVKNRKYGVYIGGSRKLGKWSRLIAKMRLN